jgi:hypothetical protein
MYRHCIYCSADLKTNEAIEAFPIGRTVAFDAAKGRLWAVCPKCARWNLAPIEERWEAVERAEHAFRDTRLRVQSQNIGLAKLSDGTRLIRVGEALLSELAAWRYGDQLVRRRRHYLLATGVAMVAGIAAAGGLALATASSAAMVQIVHFPTILRQVQGQRVFHGVCGPAGTRIPVRRWQLQKARLTTGEDRELGLAIPHIRLMRPPAPRRGRPRDDPNPLVLRGEAARMTLTRGAVILNSQGANRKRLGVAMELLTEAGSPEDYLRHIAALEPRLTSAWNRPKEPALHAADLLALEMALHEESERRALEGELSVLEAAWREAEEIAGIADRLAIAPGEG